MIKHIMIPYDKSEPANRAFEYAVDLAKKYNSTISIVSCVVIQVPTDPYFGTAYMETTKLLREDALSSISKLEPRLRESNIPFKTEVLEVISITESLISYSELHNVDLIIIGSRGLGGFKKLLLGSVASGVSQHSKCPVLIVK
ncbi:universal stress protein [Candidatus Nitrosotalea bavarica]|uniref:universal stress protein n=1 Tax=Candidatus Nitrosotalea bavarica TaxID=1903277 RepID=UPI0013FDFA9E|nr:universal stress protein [Candidatus Nitrosotalea bavarica]